jgi:hypothetical protein
MAKDSSRSTKHQWISMACDHNDDVEISIFRNAYQIEFQLNQVFFE